MSPLSHNMPLLPLLYTLLQYCRGICGHFVPACMGWSKNYLYSNYSNTNFCPPYEKSTNFKLQVGSSGAIGKERNDRGGRLIEEYVTYYLFILIFCTRRPRRGDLQTAYTRNAQRPNKKIVVKH
jgi:hypothetical protein